MRTLTALVFVFISLSGRTWGMEPSLEILPSQSVLTKPVGQSVLFTCKTRVDDPNLISHFQWLDIRNRTIDKNNKFTQGRFTIDTIPADKALALIIQPLQKNDAGTYTCTAKYANSRILTKTVTLSPIVAVTWEDAPQEQYPLAGRDYRIRCKVKADPAPHVEWKFNGHPLPDSRRYVVETDGLVIQNVTESDDGVYTCRAFVIDTGELSERHINVEVHTPPEIVVNEMVRSLEAVDGESASVACKASGKPAPKYAWIKASSQENLATTERFSVNDITGVLTITRVTKEDTGDLKCVAHNGAGSVEATVRLLVLVKPSVMDLTNITVAVGNEARLTCRSTGSPLPAITFRKLSSPKRMIAGQQMDDDRLIVEQREDRERGEAVGTLIITKLVRKDDGLYQCIASNKGGEQVKNGHIQVEFAPSFEHTPMKEAWSWNRRPVNLTCVAESIPNATIVWRLNERDIDKDPNFRKYGNGPHSSLLVTPSDRRFYGIYKCVAQNQYGEAQHEVRLREAHIPGELIQAKMDVVTATTITFKFTGPGNTGGRPIKAYVVSFKSERQFWNEALNKTWPVDTPYILEGLTPQVSYVFRFAALNEVGLGPWGAAAQYTMPKRSFPEEPLILNQPVPEGHVISPYSDRFELRWKKPADNGEYIDRYDIGYCIVHKINGIWEETEDECNRIDLRRPEQTSVDLADLSPSTFYKLELRAHNAIGFSTPAQVYMHTAPGEDSMMFHHETDNITSSLLIAAVVTLLVIILIIVDVFCYFINKNGLLWLMCGKKKTPKPKSETVKRNSEGRELLSNGNRDGKIRIETTPMLDNGYKRDTTVEYDVKKSISKTSFVGKDSAV